jgi:hypothetical protein
VSLRGSPVNEVASLPGGGEVAIRVGVPEDSYIPAGESETVDVELRVGDEVVAVVNTILDPDQDAEARRLAREIKSGLESGELAVSAAAIEPLADRLR